MKREETRREERRRGRRTEEGNGGRGTREESINKKVRKRCLCEERIEGMYVCGDK